MMMSEFRLAGSYRENSASGAAMGSFGRTVL